MLEWELEVRHCDAMQLDVFTAMQGRRNYLLHRITNRLILIYRWWDGLTVQLQGSRKPPAYSKRKSYCVDCNWHSQFFQVVICFWRGGDTVICIGKDVSAPGEVYSVCWSKEVGVRRDTWHKDKTWIAHYYCQTSGYSESQNQCSLVSTRTVFYINRSSIFRQLTHLPGFDHGSFVNSGQHLSECGVCWDIEGEAIDWALTMIIDYTCSTYERKKPLGGENSAHKASPIEWKFPT